MRLINFGDINSQDLPKLLQELEKSCGELSKTDPFLKGGDIDVLIRDILNVFDFSKRGFTSEKLRQLIKNFTLSYERQVLQNAVVGNQKLSVFKGSPNGLKFLLMKLLEILANVGQTDKESIKAELDNLTKITRNILQTLDIINIGTQQWENQPLFLKIPFFYEDERSELDIIMNFKGKEEDKAGDSEFLMTFITELSALGRIKASILLKGERIFSSILLDNRFAAEFLETNKNLLIDKLSEVGIEGDRFFSRILYDGNPASYVVASPVSPTNLQLIDFHV